MEQIVAGLDIGTSMIKILLYGKKGGIYFDCLPHCRKNSNGKEFDPDKLLEDINNLIRKTIMVNRPLKISAIGLASFFPSLIVLDSRGKPLTGIISWLDHRGDEIAQEHNEQKSFARALHQRTGCVVNGSYPIWKILWLKMHRKEIYKKANKYLSLTDYLVYRLTGKYLVSYAIASTTGLFNLSSLEWDKGALKLTGLSTAQLPECRDVYHSEAIPQEMRYKMGLDGETLLVLGAGDGHLSSIGSGCRDTNKLCSTIGTSAALRLVGFPQKLDSSVWKYYLANDKYIYGIASNAGLRAMAWFHEHLFYGKPDSLFRDMEKIEIARSTDIICLPFPYGERGVNSGMNMTASFFGISAGHTTDDLYQAMVEGILFNLYYRYEILTKSDRPREIVATGGYTNSEKMLQMQSDIFNLEISIPEFKEPGALGAALIAMSALGANRETAKIAIRYGKVYFPNKLKNEKYMHKYGQYKKRLLAMY